MPTLGGSSWGLLSSRHFEVCFDNCILCLHWQRNRNHLKLCSNKQQNAGIERARALISRNKSASLFILCIEFDRGVVSMSFNALRQYKTITVKQFISFEIGICIFKPTIFFLSVTKICPMDIYSDKFPIENMFIASAIATNNFRNQPHHELKWKPAKPFKMQLFPFTTTTTK